jgi:hypothetical protein
MATPPDYTFGYGVSTKMPQLRCSVLYGGVAGYKDWAATPPGVLSQLRRGAKISE